jgi:hypothetical protein
MALEVLCMSTGGWGVNQEAGVVSAVLEKGGKRTHRHRAYKHVETQNGFLEEVIMRQALEAKWPLSICDRTHKGGKEERVNNSGESAICRLLELHPQEFIMSGAHWDGGECGGRVGLMSTGEKNGN